MEKVISNKKGSFWSIGQISMAAYFGGPIGGCYLLGKNYQQFGLHSEAKKAHIAGFLGTIGLVLMFFFIPEELIEKVPSSMIPMVYTGVISTFAAYQKPLMELGKGSGEKRFSYFWCLIISNGY